jgi:hypothetical protein
MRYFEEQFLDSQRDQGIEPLGQFELLGEPDDAVHLLSDLYAVVQAAGAPAGPGLPPRALFITSLCPTAPLVLLNASLGDSAALGPAACACPLAAHGWTTQLHTIRSFEKLTAGGMMFLDDAVIRVLEEALPARLGGGPSDYQLVEAEAPDGQPALRLLVHPRVALEASTGRARPFSTR